jgi:hypothetical protein
MQIAKVGVGVEDERENGFGSWRGRRREGGGERKEEGRWW